MNKNKNKIFCLMGPTGVGKTALALRLVERLPFEIISVDSAMIYRGMDIGTAKPTVAELAIAPHSLINICDPKESYSAGQFRRDALLQIKNSIARGRVPLLVGGTMLYFYVLQYGISRLPPAEENIRIRIREQQEKLGLETLYSQLQEIDPKTASRISKTDTQRIHRALEVYEITGKTLSALKDMSPPEKLPYDVTNVALSFFDKSFHREKIEERFKEMLRLGFVAEVQQLYQRGDLCSKLPAIRTVGYRQIWQYLSRQINHEQMLAAVPQVTMRLVKRQLTWLRSWQHVQWFDSGSDKLLENVMNFLKF